MNQYSFQYSTRDDCGSDFPVAKTITQNVEFHDEVLWTVVLDDFLSFLSSVYGYDIRDQVEYLSYEEKLQALSKKHNLDQDDEDEEDADDKHWRAIL